VAGLHLHLSDRAGHGAAYEITQAECRTLARQGPVYNPYKQQRREEAGRVVIEGRAVVSVRPAIQTIGALSAD
jgi:hypothetical protein